MSSGQRARTRENFPTMKVRGGRRRHGQRQGQIDMASLATTFAAFASQMQKMIDAIARSLVPAFAAFAKGERQRDYLLAGGAAAGKGGGAQ